MGPGYIEPFIIGPDISHNDHPEVIEVLVHSITTTSEANMQEYLSKCHNEHKKTFVLTHRIPDDAAHVRYDVFVYVDNGK